MSKGQVPCHAVYNKLMVDELPIEFGYTIERAVNLSPKNTLMHAFYIIVKGEFGFWSRVEGRGSRVEGRGSRVEGTKSRVEGRGSRVICRGSRVTCRGFLKMKIKSKIKRKTSLGFGFYVNKSVNVPVVHDKTNK